VPNVFIKQQLERKYNDLISVTLAKNGLNPITIEYKISPLSTTTRAPQFDEPIFVTTTNQEPAGSGAVRASTNNSFSHSYRQGINERYTFDNFIVGAGNELAFAACQSIAQLPGKQVQPALFVRRRRYRQNPPNSGRRQRHL